MYVAYVSTMSYQILVSSRMQLATRMPIGGHQIGDACLTGASPISATVATANNKFVDALS
jgi:hypothetical protein